jgi:hypothetical protein
LANISVNETEKAIAVVESEKTAIIASVYFPQLIWVATGSLSGLSYDKIKVFKDRKVILFPDSNGFDKWSKIAKDVASLMKISVSDLLNRKLTEEELTEGYDIADYLLKLPISDFRDNNEPFSSHLTKIALPAKSFTTPNTPQPKTTMDWSDEVNALEVFFQKTIIHTTEIMINTSTKIVDVNKFIKSHIAVLKGNDGKNVFHPFLERLSSEKSSIKSSRG